jgi:excisionase family DNA binding protein
MAERINMSIEEMPATLNAADVAAVLGISRAGAYELMHSKSFPTMKIGVRRYVVLKKKLLQWMEQQFSI